MIKSLVLHTSQQLGLFAVSRYLTRRSLRVLCYHGTWLGPLPHYGDCLFMNPEGFAQRMRNLKGKGYRVITLAEGLRKLAAGSLEAREVVITIDDGWKGTFDDMLPVLHECGFPATLYVATQPIVQREPLIHLLTAYLLERSSRTSADYAKLFPELKLRSTQPARVAEALSRHILTQDSASARLVTIDEIGKKLGIDARIVAEGPAFRLMTPEEVRAALEQGIDIQLHTHTHKMHGFTLDRVRAEIELNRQHISQMTGQPPSELVHFCYPSGLFHPSVFQLLRESGIVSATTTDFGLNAPDSNPLALKRILDCNSMSDLDLEARLSGFWSIAQWLKSVLMRMKPFRRRTQRPAQTRMPAS